VERVLDRNVSFGDHARKLGSAGSLDHAHGLEQVRNPND
jgi:hypothetical protein